MRAALLIILFIAAVVPPVAHSQPASDITGHWAEERITLLAQRGIVVTSDQRFRPDDPVTRADFVRWLVGASGLPVRPVLAAPFIDVPPYHPAAAHIETALSQGWLMRVPLFQPDGPEMRGDAVTTAVRVLGYAPEAVLLAGQPLPYDDTLSLPGALQGAIAVAHLTDPALLREPPRTSFNAEAAMTRGEAAALAAGVLLAGDAGVTLHASIPVAAGAELRVEKRGVLRVSALWRVQIAAFVAEENARRLAAQIRERGLAAVVELEDGLYKVRVGSFASPGEADRVRAQLAAEGFTTWLVQSLPSFEALPGPSRTTALVVDLTAGLRLVTATGDGTRMRRQRPSELAQRTGAIAAINGNFFANSGDPLGCLVIEGEVVSEPDPQRTCAGITSNGTLTFDRVQGDLAVVAPDGIRPISGANRERRADELILYRPIFDESTRTNAFGAEAAVVNGVVTAVEDLRGNTPIPRDGFVLSGHGRARQWILQMLRPGLALTVQTRLLSRSGDARWDQIRQAVGGGPRLLSGGQFAASTFTGLEGFSGALTERRHPRTAIGVLGDGRIVLLVVDGRRPSHSLGMTLLELAVELRRLGAVDAMNLDGGGSSVLVAGGR
ncbi:MAG TPA: phosphodiester glycosidase family protein, partial [bacterium]